MHHLATLTFLAVALFPPLLRAQDPAPKPPRPAIKKINEAEYKIGKVHLNKATREISFGAGVNLTEGLLEFIIVNQKGKIHESLFISDISPLNLNIALKLLGIKESPELFEIVDEDYRPTGQYPEVAPKTKAAARMDIFVEWGKEKKRVTLNELISNNVTEKTMDPGPWLNTGSYIHEGKFKAEVTGDLIAVFTSQPAMINYPGRDREHDDIWITNTKRAPKEGTIVKIIIKPHQP